MSGGGIPIKVGGVLKKKSGKLIRTGASGSKDCCCGCCATYCASIPDTFIWTLPTNIDGSTIFDASFGGCSYTTTGAGSPPQIVHTEVSHIARFPSIVTMSRIPGTCKWSKDVTVLVDVYGTPNSGDTDPVLLGSTSGTVTLTLESTRIPGDVCGWLITTGTTTTFDCIGYLDTMDATAQTYLLPGQTPGNTVADHLSTVELGTGNFDWTTDPTPCDPCAYWSSGGVLPELGGYGFSFCNVCDCATATALTITVPSFSNWGVATPISGAKTLNKNGDPCDGTDGSPASGNWLYEEGDVRIIVVWDGTQWVHSYIDLVGVQVIWQGTSSTLCGAFAYSGGLTGNDSITSVTVTG